MQRKAYEHELAKLEVELVKKQREVPDLHKWTIQRRIRESEQVSNSV